MRRFLSPRWLGLHAAMLVIVAGFCALGWWQLRRAAEGNALSWGYTFEWPLFAGFVVVFWLRAMRDEARDARARDAAGPAETPAVALPERIRAAGREQAGPDDAADDEELAAYNAYLARLNAEANRTAAWLARRGARRRASGWAGRPRAPGPVAPGGPDGGTLPGASPGTEE